MSLIIMSVTIITILSMSTITLLHVSIKLISILIYLTLQLLFDMLAPHKLLCKMFFLPTIK